MTSSFSSAFFSGHVSTFFEVDEIERAVKRRSLGGWIATARISFVWPYGCRMAFTVMHRLAGEFGSHTQFHTGFISRENSRYLGWLSAG